jgi:tetratricopeptide (TPR) repeat protein
MRVTPEYDERIVQARRLAATGAWRDARAMLAPLERSAPVDVPAELLLLRGETLLRLGELADARHWLLQSLDVVVARHDRITERALWNQLGVSCFAMGELDAAERAFLEALRMGKQEGDDLLIARATNNLGAIANVRGQRDLAVAHFHLAIPAFQRLGEARGLAETYHHLALSAREMGQLDDSEEYERRVIEYATFARVPRMIAMAETGLAETCLLGGDAVLSERRAIEAARRFEELNDPANQADALRLAGAARAAQGRFSEASDTLDRAVEIARAHDVAIVEAEALWERAKSQAALGDLARAGADANGALAIFERLGSALAAPVREWVEKTIS